jgi:hypothetical protein
MLIADAKSKKHRNVRDPNQEAEGRSIVMPFTISH